MRTLAIMALIAILASTPACASFDTSTEIETSDKPRVLDCLYEHITHVTVKVLVMCEDEGDIVSKHGTGVIVSKKGNTYALITNRHVVDDVFSGSGKVYYNVEHPEIGNVRVRMVTTDHDRDLALLVFESDKDIPVARFVADTPPLLSDVYHYGFGGLWFKGPFATKGVFSSKDRFWTTLPCAWTVTCNVWYGSSGGGVFTEKGGLMGITTVIDIERHECLPWLVGMVPYTEVKEFMATAGY